MAGSLENKIAWIYERVFGESPRMDGDPLGPLGIRRVAAGDPSQSVSYVADGFLNLPERLRDGERELDLSRFSKFIVEGSSMVPRGVLSGDLLLCPLSPRKFRSKYVIVEVDKAYYDNKRKDLKFDFKLRHELTEVHENETEAALARRLAGMNSDIFLKENRDNFSRKFREARRYFNNPERRLAVSETFRDGRLRYSFYPVSLARYYAEYALRRSGDSWSVINLQEGCPV